MTKNLDEYMDTTTISQTTKKRVYACPLPGETARFAAVTEKTGSHISKWQSCGIMSLVTGGAVFHR